MRAMMLERVEPSMKLGKTLFSNDGRVLLQRGTELNQSYLEHLRTLGYTALYILERDTDEPEPKDVVSEQTRSRAVSALKEAFSGLKDRQLSPRQKFQQDWSGRRLLTNAATTIISEVNASRELCVQLMELRSADSEVFAHSVNVCILGMALARKLDVPYGKMVDLAIGLLIHDVGKLLLPEELRGGDRSLSPEEEQIFRSHCEGGYGLLRDMGGSLGATSKIVALQHHEQWDGGGYPKGLRGEQIHEFAQICAVVDTYDRLTTSAAQGRRVLPHEALEYLMGAGGSLFRLSMVQAFMSIVAPYPIGTTLRLNSGEQGVVIRMEKGVPHRPVLRLQGPGEHGEEFSLLNHPDRVVVEVLELH